MLGPFVNDEYSDVTFALYALEGARHGAARARRARPKHSASSCLHVPGVKKVNILGERPERIFVEFSYARLATLGIRAQDIFAALQQPERRDPRRLDRHQRRRRCSYASMAPTTICSRSATPRSWRGGRTLQAVATSRMSDAATRTRRPS